tara:strand:- start:681 stop:1100 length:420 start_codon:yes stop_codon:yes gene_type:complete
MAGGNRKIHEHPNANINGFDKRPEDATKGGRKPSIRKQLIEMVGDNGTYTIAAEQILSINKDGSVDVDIPTSERLVLKLMEWVDSDKGNNSLKALQMIIEQIDGKPKQEVDVSGSLDGEVKRLTPEERKQFNDVLESEY